MIDIHSHILPGLDDGSPSFETSLAMLIMAAESGTTDIVATPHCNDEFAFHPATNAELASQLQTAVDAHFGSRKITLHLGCDFHLSLRNIRQALSDPTRFTIAGHQYMLAEFSDIMIFEGVSNLFDQLIQAGIRPIVTHPERNSMLQKRPKELRRWVDQGCLLQITAHSYLGTFGPSAKSFALDLTRQGIVHIVASDAHDTTRRTPRLDQAFASLQQTFGADVARALCLDHPMAVIQGYHLAGTAYPDAEGPKKPWYRFW